jgi:hypothetical protein
MAKTYRRTFLSLAAQVLASTAFAPLGMLAERTHHRARRPKFPDASPRWGRAWDQALSVLAGNIRMLPNCKDPVLIEGAEYGGIWMECAPLEGMVYAGLADYLPQREGQPTPLAIARANHSSFFALQREDGQFPPYIRPTEAGYGQIQMVVPIAATAWELAQKMRDEAFLNVAYIACSKWDAWLRKYRDTHKTGLTEGFCTFDTGHDNSPRWAGMPVDCPGGDARICPPIASLPRLCPDLSATTYGARVALASMADALGKKDEAERWREDAEAIRRLIIAKLYSSEDAAFYDLDAQGNFVRVRGDLMTRVLGEHVLKLDIASDRHIFEEIWARQLHNPKSMWTPYPFPSIAIDDPTFMRPIPANSWGGASQPLTAIRTTRWMEHYGKQKEFVHLMRRWVEAISRPNLPLQQLDPLTGEFTRPDKTGYTPIALVYLDFIRRLQDIPNSQG